MDNISRFAEPGHRNGENLKLAIFSGSTTFSQQLLKSLEVTALRWLDGVFKLPDYQVNYQTGRIHLDKNFSK